MPITKSALKKQRADKRRALVNKPIKARMKSAVKTARSKLDPESVRSMYSALDLAVKGGVTSKNTAARLKARVVAAVKRKGEKK